ncbi:MAG: phosphopantetheine-binding protein [Nitrococcus sp.]|nr:phosphopantetheine-binding protein [Nitrococcus sp.]
MDDTEVFEEIRTLLDQVLQLGGRSIRFSPDTALFGSIPEFDSMAVVSVLTAIEESFGFVIDDDEISAQAFETVGSLAYFVSRKVAEEA